MAVKSEVMVRDTKGICPSCHRHTLTFGKADVAGCTSVSIPFSCDWCEAEGCETYSLSYVCSHLYSND